jgi:hypothetical protein
MGMENTNTQAVELERTVQVTLAGETRTIVIKRYSEKHCWYTETPVICKFRTGNKLHTSHHAQVFERAVCRGFGPDDYFFSTEVIHNRHAKVVAWADKNPGNSGWTSNGI